MSTEKHPPTPSSQTAPVKTLRADARRNHARVLDAARDAFAEHGFAVPLDAIAERAGVGPGTVYRHFPTKEALFAAVTEARVRDLVAAARSAAAADDTGAAFDGFLVLLTTEARAKRDMPDVLDGAVGIAKDELHAAVADLVAAAQRAGAVRAGIAAGDLVVLLKGMLQAALASADPGLPDRLLAVVRDGLRPPPGEAAPPAPRSGPAVSRSTDPRTGPGS